ncbi:hypothetical protein HYU22_04125 [Candidatus Woesearchaeota archaeon]|nr:hypothetical protein [Candidatus Woesearchaeota archaeon]
MPTFIACLSTGKGTWTEVVKILTSQPWTKVFLITDQFGKEHFTPNSVTELLLVDLSLDTPALKDAITKGLQGKVTDFEVALNFASGSGKEHMALLEAVMELGLNFRLVTLNNERVAVMGLEQ